MATQEHPAVALELRRTFPAPRERVFRAWTTAEEIRSWQAPGPMTTPFATVDLRVGGAYQIHIRAPDGREHRVAGVYREVDPPSRLVYTWRWETDGPEDETLVTVEFKDRGQTTEVVLRHERFRTADQRARHETGWTGCLAKLGHVF